MHLLTQARRHPYLIVIWAVLTFICSAEHAGFMIYLIALPCLLYAVIRCLFNLRSPEVRGKYVFFIGIILLASAIVAGVHVWRHHQARDYADNILAELDKYQQQHGKLPTNLNEIPALAHDGKRPHMLYYRNDKGSPFLLYAATFVPFESWHYDFKEKQWVYDYD